MKKIFVRIIVFGYYILTEVIADKCNFNLVQSGNNQKQELLNGCKCLTLLQSYLDNCSSNGIISTYSTDVTPNVVPERISTYSTTDVTPNVVPERTTTNSTRQDNFNYSKCQTECQLSTTVHTEEDTTETTTNMSQDQQTVLKVTKKQTTSLRADCPSGSIVGYLIGGAVFGSLITIFFFMLHRRIQKKQIRNRAVETFQNPAYNAETMSINERAVEEDTGKSTYSEISDQKSMKVSHVAPIRRNENTSKTNDGVYNHLNETASDDRSEYYDHAKPGASVSTPADGYCTVTIDNSGNDEHIEDNATMDDNDKNSEKAKADGYFMLEKIQ